MDLNDVKKQIHSLLLKKNKGIMLCDIDGLFSSVAGHNIPYDKFGFKTLLAFLQTLTDILKIANYDGVSWIEPLSGVNSINSSKRISKKKPARINTPNSISQKRHMSKLTNDSDWLNNGKASSHHIASSHLSPLNATYSQNDIKKSSKPMLDIFQNTMDNKISSFNTRSLNNQSQSLHKPKTIPSKMNSKKNASNFHSRKLLENFLRQNKIGTPIFTFLGPPQEKTYQAKLSINGREWNSFDCDTKEIAEEECSAKALRSLNELIKDEKCVTNVSERDLIYRIVEILKEDPFHSLSKNGVDEAYKKKYNASISPNWIESAKKFQNLLKMEEIASSNKTLITVSLPILSPIVSSSSLPVTITRPFEVTSSENINEDTEEQSYKFATIDKPGFKDVIIGEVFDVTDVIIRLFNSYDEYVDLIEKMIARYKNLPDKAKTINVGKVYAAVFEETVDRVIILKKLDNNCFLCKNVDDGGIESVPSSNIHYLDQENLKLPFQAINAQLEGLQLFSDNIIATEYLQQRVFKVENAFSIASVKCIEKPLKIVLFDVSEKGCININEEILQYLRRHAFDDIIRCPNTEVKGFLVESFNNGEITVQLKNKYLDLLIEKQKEINNLCNSKSSYLCDMIEFGLSVGTDQIFYGLYGDNWYRITINELINDQIVSVRYVDYGSFNFLKQLQIRKLDSSIDPLYTLPFLGIQCILDVSKDDCFEFTDVTASALYQMVINLPINIKIVEPANEQKICSVRIFKEELGKMIDVNEQLFLKKDCQLKITKDIDSLELNEVDDSEYVKNDEPNDEIVGSSEPIPDPILPEDKDNPFSVRIIHPVNQSNFYVHILNKVVIEKYKILLNDIQEFYENDENKFDLDPKLFKKGKFYAVKIENSWMRAKLIDQRSGELALYLVDIGDIKLASPSNVQALYSRFRSLPMMAVKATLPKTIQWNDCDSLFFSRIVKGKDFTAKLNSVISTEDGPVLDLSLVYNGQDIQQLVIGGHELPDL